nr:MAG TPA: hypothetical protein [Caudoviricetes sp.]
MRWTRESHKHLRLLLYINTVFHLPELIKC